MRTRHGNPSVTAPCCALLLGWASVLPHAAAADRDADHLFPSGVEVYFLSAAESAEAIVDDGLDPFFDNLTMLDIELRLGRKAESANLDQERARFRDFVRTCVVDWTDEERTALLSTLEDAHAKCTAIVPSLIPKKWRFIKTDGREGGAPYTRGTSIVFPEEALAAGVPEKVVIHETFHVYSRLNPEKRARLYRAIGFEPLENVSLPPALEAKRLTNPDGIDFRYVIDVNNARGGKLKVLPLVYSKHDSPRANVKGFFEYITFGLFEVRRQNGAWSVKADDRGQAKPLSLGAVKGLFEQIGRNTGYIIHPDEILADNVALLVLSRSGDKSLPVPSPNILTKIERVLRTR